MLLWFCFRLSYLFAFVITNFINWFLELECAACGMYVCVCIVYDVHVCMSVTIIHVVSASVDGTVAGIVVAVAACKLLASNDDA